MIQGLHEIFQKGVNIVSHQLFLNHYLLVHNKHQTQRIHQILNQQIRLTVRNEFQIRGRGRGRVLTICQGLFIS